MWNLLSSLRGSAMPLVRSTVDVLGFRSTVSAFHSLTFGSCGSTRSSPLANQCSKEAIAAGPRPLLQAAPTPLLNLACGFKVKGRLKRRCKDCYFVMRQERLYVICKTHPRHKQMSMKKHDRNTWFLTDATQGKERAW
uniref:Ribosomal protein n=1 Tax=Anopheles marajoara TaxID=58244 RepID=A0A2M4C306_9DIPT